MWESSRVLGGSPSLPDAWPARRVCPSPGGAGPCHPCATIPVPSLPQAPLGGLWVAPGIGVSQQRGWGHTAANVLIPHC